MTRKLIIPIGLAVGLGLSALSFPVFSETAPVFTLETSPQLPFSGDKVTVSVSALNFNAASTTFAWFRDGVKLSASSGLGRSSTTVATDPTRQEIIPIKVEAAPGPGFGRGEQSTVIYTLPSPSQQEEAASGLASDFTLEASKTNPDAGETVRMEVITFAFDKNNANYQWHVNGVLQRGESGRGQYRFSLESGPEGATKTVRADVTTPAGETRSKSVIIQTVSAPLYWWADTTVPYWYRGKALASLNSRVTVMALPAIGNAAGLNYRWEFNNGFVPQSSGIGKTAFSFSLNFPVEERIDVAIKDASGTFSKTAGIGIGPVLPGAGIYELKPLRGLAYEKQLAEFSAPSGGSYDFTAAPFFFPEEAEKNLKYVWTLNGQTFADAVVKPWLFTLESKAGTISDNQLNVEVFGPQKTGDRAFASFRANLR